MIYQPPTYILKLAQLLLPSFVMAVVAFGLAIPSQAQADTNSVLYQQGMDITGELTLLHEANGSQAKKMRNAPTITNRLPRHVFQKAREVLIKVQVSRKLNGHFVGSRRTVRRYPRNCPQCSGGRYQHRRRHLDNHPSDPFSPRIGQVSGQVLSATDELSTQTSVLQGQLDHFLDQIRTG